ncbi:YjjG family noncanonical pyrimidine nucleotidase [Companilactobacillus zhongbaensis]|uniref:YjjG family noncanonical pyrimidine nucleotidase n=1 Tax=Companilactobacillus zhongbaensis TaxID=2486009 RepID=UPI000F78E8B1|nr:YjjG family noncanonical pyrimidine nucleotidase [Companilactobacillus zhongbaensis]
MKYPIILFDLDSTILDTNKNAENALHKMDIAKSFAFDNHEIAYWHELNNHLWQLFEKGEISRDALLDQRFKKYFEHFNVDVDTSSFQEEYIHLFASEHELLPNARKTLSDLSRDRKLYVISNGTKFKQHAQIEGADIGQYFDDIFLSEDLGYKKPDPMFFKKMDDQLGNVPNDEMLVVGDSLTADIAGANAVDIDSVWYNPSRSKNSSVYKPTYQVDDLIKIEPLLK